MRIQQETKAFTYLDSTPFGVVSRTEPDGRRWIDQESYDDLRQTLASIERLACMEDTTATSCIRQLIAKAGSQRSRGAS